MTRAWVLEKAGIIERERSVEKGAGFGGWGAVSSLPPAKGETRAGPPRSVLRAVEDQKVLLGK